MCAACDAWCVTQDSSHGAHSAYACVCMSAFGKMSLGQSINQSISHSISQSIKARGLRSSVRRPLRDKHALSRRALTCAALARVSRTRLALLLAHLSQLTRARLAHTSRDTLREQLGACAASRRVCFARFERAHRIQRISFVRETCCLAHAIRTLSRSNHSSSFV
jgi:hypothetical protein